MLSDKLAINLTLDALIVQRLGEKSQIRRDILDARLKDKHFKSLKPQNDE